MNRPISLFVSVVSFLTAFQLLTVKDAHAQGGIGAGVMTGSAMSDESSTSPNTFEAELFSVGKNPTESGRRYGLAQFKFEYSGKTGNSQNFGFESRGMGGWKLLGATEKHHYMPFVGLELNLQAQTNSNLTTDVKNRAARMAGQANSNIAAAQAANPGLIGNPDAAVLRQHFAYLMAMLSAGGEARFKDCRVLALLRGGIAGGGQLRNDGQSYAADAKAFGFGSNLNCPRINASFDWTRVLQPASPMDLANVDVMLKPFQKVPLAVGVEMESTVTDADAPKTVTGTGGPAPTKVRNSESHGLGVVRLVF
jgi:hypothetical protein